jgi:hypothetical protein
VQRPCGWALHHIQYDQPTFDIQITDEFFQANVAPSCSEQRTESERPLVAQRLGERGVVAATDPAGMKGRPTKRRRMNPALECGQAPFTGRRFVARACMPAGSVVYPRLIFEDH